MRSAPPRSARRSSPADLRAPLRGQQHAGDGRRRKLDCDLIDVGEAVVDAESSDRAKCSAARRRRPDVRRPRSSTGACPGARGLAGLSHELLALAAIQTIFTNPLLARGWQDCVNLGYLPPRVAEASRVVRGSDGLDQTAVKAAQDRPSMASRPRPRPPARAPPRRYAVRKPRRPRRHG